MLGQHAIPLAEAPIGDVAACAIFVLLIVSRSSGIRTYGLAGASFQHRYEYGHAPGICRAISGMDAGLTSREMDSALPEAQKSGSKSLTSFCVSDQTVKTHVSHIYTKLGIHSKEELIELVRKGLFFRKGPRPGRGVEGLGRGARGRAICRRVLIGRLVVDVWPLAAPQRVRSSLDGRRRYPEC